MLLFRGAVLAGAAFGCSGRFFDSSPLYRRVYIFAGVQVVIGKRRRRRRGSNNIPCGG